MYVRVKRGSHALVIGSTNIFGAKVPRFVRVHGVWPRIVLLFGDEKYATSRRVSINQRKQFTVSLPAKTLGFPPVDLDSSSEKFCRRLAEFVFSFDFDPQPPCAALAVIRQIAELMRDYPGLAEKTGVYLEKVVS